MNNVRMVVSGGAYDASEQNVSNVGFKTKDILKQASTQIEISPHDTTPRIRS